MFFLQRSLRRSSAAFFVSLLLLAGGCAQPADDGATAEAPAPAPAQATAEPEAATEIEAARLLERIRGDEADRPLVLDVRTPEEFAEGHVPGAVNIPHTELPERLAEVRAAGDVDIVLYCRSGRRAGVAHETLAEAGFQRLLHLAGDMNGWTRQDMPVERPSE